MKQNSGMDPDTACWGWHPARKEHEAGYTLFHRIVECPAPANFKLAVSADNRFNFYLDGTLLGRGPLRSHPEHYYYDEYSGTIESVNSTTIVRRKKAYLKE